MQANWIFRSEATRKSSSLAHIAFGTSPEGEASHYGANNFLNLIAFPLFYFPAPQAAKGQGIPSRHELIPDAPDGQDVLRMRRIFFHRFADAIDVDRDRSRIAE